MAKGSLVQTDQGLVRIEDFSEGDGGKSAPEQIDDFTIHGHSVVSGQRVGECESIRIRLDSGAEIIGASETYRVSTPDGWTPLSILGESDIVFGDFSVSHATGGKAIEWEGQLRTSANNVVPPEQMTPRFAKFLGMIAADGGAYEQTGRVEITTRSDKVEREYAALCEFLFESQVKIEYDERRSAVRRVYVTSRNLARLVTCLIGSGAYDKRVPEPVIRGSAAEKRAFCEGLTLDGHNNSNGFTVYSGMSKALAYQTAQLLRSFGLPKVYEGRKWVNGSEAYSYQVTISNELQQLIEATESHKNPRPQYVRYKVPVDLPELSLGDYERGTSAYYAVRSARNRNNSYLFNETADKIGIGYSGVAYKITDVENVGQRELYGLDVESSQPYLVNGVTASPV